MTQTGDLPQANRCLPAAATTSPPELLAKTCFATPELNHKMTFPHNLEHDSASPSPLGKFAKDSLCHTYKKLKLPSSACISQPCTDFRHLRERGFKPNHTRRGRVQTVRCICLRMSCACARSLTETRADTKARPCQMYTRTACPAVHRRVAERGSSAT